MALIQISALEPRYRESPMTRFTMIASKLFSFFYGESYMVIEEDYTQAMVDI